MPQAIRRETGQLPLRVERALRGAQQAEQRAIGSERRPAFELTRNLLGGARRAGYSIRALADTLGVSVGSLRARASQDGPVSAQHVLELAGLPPNRLANWVGQGWLAPLEDGTGRYLASDLIHALGRD
jgi:hypothetical protein